MSYNGWTNYETWAVKLWLDNEEGSYLYVTEHANERPDKYEFAQWLKEMHEEAQEALEIPTSVFTDLLGAAMSEVNWYEIAEAYLNDAEEELEGS